MRALIFDLDGTLIDTVYAHVFAWQRALAESGLAIEGWKIHRRIGMSGGLFTRAVGRVLARSPCCGGCASRTCLTASRPRDATRRSTARSLRSGFRLTWSSSIG